MSQVKISLERSWDLVTQGDLDEALQIAEKLIELEGDTAESHHLIGYIRMLEGHTELALDHMHQSLQINEHYFDARIHTAEILIHHLGEYETALSMIADTYELCETADELVEILLLEADIYLLMGEIQSAQDIIARIPQEPIDNPHLVFEVGRIQFEVGDFDSAETILREAIVLNPQHADAHYYLALLLEQREQISEATLEFIRTREIDEQTKGQAWSLSREAFEKRVQNILQKLPDSLSQCLEGTLVIITNLPGLEIISEGIDPRTCVLLDETHTSDAHPALHRMFIYQKNVERLVNSPDMIGDEIQSAIETELIDLFPHLEIKATNQQSVVDSGSRQIN